MTVSDRRTDEMLTAKAQGGDSDAFGRLLMSHDDAMRAVAYRMLGDRAAMDDVLQVAYMKAYRNLDRFRAEASFSTWLHRIVVNACYDWLRSAGRRAESPLYEAANVESPVDWEYRITVGNQLHEALQTLPPEQRAAVVLVDGQGLSYDEAAEAMEIERGTVASRLNRARAALRNQLAMDEDGNR